jgi:hypothetical protein
VNFSAFASAHGLRIRQVLDDGRWHRVPTDDKPRKRNGAYVFDGQSGAVQTGFEVGELEFGTEVRRGVAESVEHVGPDREVREVSPGLGPRH